jgi:hypothetical protein
MTTLIAAATTCHRQLRLQPAILNSAAAGSLPVTNCVRHYFLNRPLTRAMHNETPKLNVSQQH